MPIRAPGPWSLEPSGSEGVPVGEMRLGWTLMVAGTALGAWAAGDRTPSSAAAGGALMIPGVLLALASVRTLGNARRLVTWGPYRWVRHPYFLAVLILLLGCIVALRAWPALILYIPALRLTVARAHREEHNLRLKFGPEWERYTRAVPFLLPLGPPLPGGRLPGNEVRVPAPRDDDGRGGTEEERATPAASPKVPPTG